MKILQINCVYKQGSTGKIVYDIHRELINQNIESVICYGFGSNVSENNVYKIACNTYCKFNKLLSFFTGIKYGGCYLGTRKIINLIKSEKPDVVHLHCINGYFVNIYKLVRWLNTNNIKTVLTLHAEFMYTANCSYAYECDKWKTGCGKCPHLKSATKSLFFDQTDKSYEKMQSAFNGFKNIEVVSVSPWVKERAEQSLILADLPNRTILNGIDTKIFNSNKLSDEIRNQYHGKKIVFHVTAMFSDRENHIKGGKSLIDLASQMRDKDIVFIVAGKYDLNKKLPNNIVVLGEVRDQEVLAQYYAAADAVVLTSKKETFSMVCAESLCCGTPVIGFEAGAPEMISISDYSEFVEQGNIKRLEQALLKWLYEKDTDTTQLSDQANKIYSKEAMIGKYMHIYRRLICEQ